MSNIFRQPGISIELPSQGRWQEGNIEFTTGKVVPTFSITASDELYLKNADHLYSGFAVTNMIKSCCPSIKDPSLLIKADIHALILAIRISSYGNTFDINGICPKCNAENTYTIDIHAVLDTIKTIEDSDLELRINDDTIVKLKPYQYGTGNEMMLEVQKMKMELAQIEEDAKSEENLDLDAVIAFQKKGTLKIAEMRKTVLSAIVSAIDSITFNGEVYTDESTKKDFVDSLSFDSETLISDQLQKLNDMSYDKDLNMTCMETDCGHQWDTILEIDESNFFGQGF